MSRSPPRPQEAFLERHVLAFEYFGAAPAWSVTTTSALAVVRVLRGRDRSEAERFIALRSHYGFDSFFCIPGKAGHARRAAWRARSAGSAAVTWSPSPPPRRWQG